MLGVGCPALLCAHKGMMGETRNPHRKLLGAHLLGLCAPLSQDLIQTCPAVALLHPKHHFPLPSHPDKPTGNLSPNFCPQGYSCHLTACSPVPSLRGMRKWLCSHRQKLLLGSPGLTQTPEEQGSDQAVAHILS